MLKSQIDNRFDGGGVIDGGGQASVDGHSNVALSELILDRNIAVESDEEGHKASDSLRGNALLIAEIVEQWRQRQDLHRAEKSLTLQIKAKCRRACGGDKKEAASLYEAMADERKPPKRRQPKYHPLSSIALASNRPFLDAREVIESDRAIVEKRLAKLAKQLPISEWWKNIRGLDYGGLAAVVGEAGRDIALYRNPSCLWKRMGLAVMPDGTRQRRIGGSEALEHGYNAARRSVIWNVGQSLFKAQSGEDPGYYRTIYDQRKAYELERGIPKGHAHNRSTHYMEKRLLKHLWQAWRGTVDLMATEPRISLPPPNL